MGRASPRGTSRGGETRQSGAGGRDKELWRGEGSCAINNQSKTSREGEDSDTQRPWLVGVDIRSHGWVDVVDELARTLVQLRSIVLRAWQPTLRATEVPQGRLSRIGFWKMLPKTRSSAVGGQRDGELAHVSHHSRRHAYTFFPLQGLPSTLSRNRPRTSMDQLLPLRSSRAKYSPLSSGKP